MEREIEIRITDENPNLSRCFDKNVELISRIKVIDNATEKILWDKLKDGILSENYSLNKDKFSNFEELEFGADYSIVTQRITNFFKNKKQLILAWFSNEKSLTTDSNTFIANCEDFFCPSADDLVVVNKNLHWVIYITHYEVFQLGQKLSTFQKRPAPNK